MFQMLVVEDDRDLNRTVCAFLNASGYQTTGCLDANDAYDVMYGTMFDLIVSDIMMPGIDGFEFAKNVRELNEDIPILFVTAAGGVLGKVISSSDMVEYIKANATVLSSIGIFFPFILAAILKSAQGSSTVALTTTAGIMAPLMETMGLNTPVLGALTVMAIGAGAMTVSHANDSYFWVVTNFGKMTPDQGYKTQTIMTLIMGISAMIGIFLMSLFF